MKRTNTLRLLLLILLLCVSFCVLTACNDGDSEGGGDGYLSFSTLTVEGNKAYGVVSNDTDSFSFLDEVKTNGDSRYIVSLDKYGIQTAATKTVPLLVGDNKVYVVEMIDGEPKSIFEVTIRRRPKYTVIFDTNGGSQVESQTIEEGSLATAPSAPTRQGYDFILWNYDFSTPINSDVTITSNWSAHVDTPYTVEYYLQNISDNGYTLVSDMTENKYGVTDSTASVEAKSIEHFTYNASKSIDSGNIEGNGSLTLKLYYTRDTYTVTFAGDGGHLVSGKAEQEVKYGGSAKAPSFYREGYTFVGFDKDYDVITEPITVTAEWNVNKYTLTIDYNNGQQDIEIEKDYGEEIGSITEPVRPGYLFTGWDLAVIPTTMPARDLTITANWKAIFNHSNGTITGLTTYAKIYTDVSIPSQIDGVNITQIAGNAFGFGNITSIVIPNSIVSIGQSAFAGCKGLTSVIIPNSVTSMGADVFSYCESLTIYCKTTTKPDGWNAGWKSTGSAVVWDCDNNDVAVDGGIYTIEDGVRYRLKDGKATVVGQSSMIKTAIIKSTVTYKGSIYNVTGIDSYAFNDCSLLKSVVISDGVTSISGSAFCYCDSLTSITIPNSVETISYNAVTNCSKVTIYCEAESKPDGWHNSWCGSSPVVWGQTAEQ